MISKPNKTKVKPKSKPAITKVTNTLSNHHEIITSQDCAKLAKLDAQQLSTKGSEYILENSRTYYVLCNTWLAMVRDVSGDSMWDIHDAIMRFGLISVIRECDQYSNTLVGKNCVVASSYFKFEYDDCPIYLIDVLLKCSDLKVALQLLRYPKRFSPSKADVVAKRGLSNFLDVNTHCKETTQSVYSDIATIKICTKLSIIISEMLDSFRVDYCQGYFSSGQAADVARPIADKLDAFSSWEPRLKHPLYPLSLTDTHITIHYGFEQVPQYICKVKAVPKSYKTPRIIAEEDAYRQFHMQAIRRALEVCLTDNGFDKMLDLHDQRPNRDLCQNGSVSGHYATIDLSSASDSISRALVWKIFPSNVFREMMKFLPTHCEVVNPQNGRVELRKLHMFCTSGSALTFATESIVFLAIAILAKQMCKVWNRSRIYEPHIFGDDMVVDVQTFDTVCDLLNKLGFTVNDTKSFSAESGYRESCGVEYSFGLDTNSKYFPRSTMKWGSNSIPTTVSELVALEKRVFSFPTARRFLIAFIRSIEPRMTSHMVGTDCADMWESSPLFVKGLAPAVLSKSRDIGKYSTEIRRNADQMDLGSLFLYREKHLCVSSLYKDNSHEMLPRSKSSRLTIVEMWLYYHFLQYGPSYDSALDELLLVSSKPSKREALTNVASVQWTYVQE